MSTEVLWTKGQKTPSKIRIAELFFLHALKHWNSLAFLLNPCLISICFFYQHYFRCFFLSAALWSLHIWNFCPRSNPLPLFIQSILLCCFQLVHNSSWQINTFLSFSTSASPLLVLMDHCSLLSINNSQFSHFLLRHTPVCRYLFYFPW